MTRLLGRSAQAHNMLEGGKAMKIEIRKVEQTRATTVGCPEVYACFDS